MSKKQMRLFWAAKAVIWSAYEFLALHHDDFVSIAEAVGRIIG